MGQKVKSFPEVRLHFLYGIWGSAFTILLKRLVQEKGRNGEKEVLKLVLGNSYDDDFDANNPGCDMNSGSSQDEVPSNKSKLTGECAKEKCNDDGNYELDRESILFNYEYFPGDEEIDYDTEEDMIGEYTKKNDEDTKFNTLKNVSDIVENNDTSPFGTPPTCPDYVGSLPTALEVEHNIIHRTYM